jgi:hypothetical protein
VSPTADPTAPDVSPLQTRRRTPVSSSADPTKTPVSPSADPGSEPPVCLLCRPDWRNLSVSPNCRPDLEPQCVSQCRPDEPQVCLSGARLAEPVTHSKRWSYFQPTARPTVLLFLVHSG